jgi:hypothetical protein
VVAVPVLWVGAGLENPQIGSWLVLDEPDQPGIVEPWQFVHVMFRRVRDESELAGLRVRPVEKPGRPLRGAH